MSNASSISYDNRLNHYDTDDRGITLYMNERISHPIQCITCKFKTLEHNNIEYNENGLINKGNIAIYSNNNISRASVSNSLHFKDECIEFETIIKPLDSIANDLNTSGTIVIDFKRNSFNVNSARKKGDFLFISLKDKIIVIEVPDSQVVRYTDKVIVKYTCNDRKKIRILMHDHKQIMQSSNINKEILISMYGRYTSYILMFYYKFAAYMPPIVSATAVINLLAVVLYALAFLLRSIFLSVYLKNNVYMNDNADVIVSFIYNYYFLASQIVIILCMSKPIYAILESINGIKMSYSSHDKILFSLILGIISFLIFDRDTKIIRSVRRKDAVACITTIASFFLIRLIFGEVRFYLMLSLGLIRQIVSF